MRIIAALVLLLVASFANAGTLADLFDVDFESAVNKRDSISFANCTGLKNVALEMECVLKKQKEYEKTTKSVRGTDPFNEKHYGGLGETEAKQKLKEIRKLWKLANKHHLTSLYAEPGQLSYELLQSEVWYLEKHLKTLSTDLSLAEKAEQMGLKGMARDIRALTGDAQNQ